MRTTSARSSSAFLGRPGRRCLEPSYFLAINSRYHLKIVSGVTMQPIVRRTFRPSALPFTAKRHR